MIEMIAALIGGVLYGLLIGIIPAAGATTGPVALFGVISYFAHEPYLGVVFLMAVVAASTTGDSFTAILLGIPGANSAAATMVDGFPLAQQGRASYAISAAVTTSTVNGLLWGCLVFLLLPWYTNLLMVLGIPELWAFTVLALATVGFVSTRFWFRSLCAITLGIFLSLTNCLKVCFRLLGSMHSSTFVGRYFSTQRNFSMYAPPYAEYVDSGSSAIQYCVFPFLKLLMFLDETVTS